jgi:biotin synthase-like enzyme
MVRVGEIASDQPLGENDKKFLKIIDENNATHVVDAHELQDLLKKAKHVYDKNFNGDVWFERSIFTNWTCGIADCKYCFLSTKPKLDMEALRSPASILAESFVMKHMGWKVGYITGGLRVEPTDYMIELLKNLHVILGEKPMMNFGPYTKKEVESFAPYISGMGSAVESFDPDLHLFICPSKPLPALIKFLGYVRDQGLKILITIILGIGEKKSDVDEVIKYVNEYNITTVQLCFLKPINKTVFSHATPPNAEYMAWWAAKLRIACPKLTLKVALVKDRIADFSLMLQAGVNCFSRYLVFDDFGGNYAQELVAECKRANRKLIGEFLETPQIDVDVELAKLPLDENLKKQMRPKIELYLKRLQKLERPKKVESEDCC